MQRLKVKVLVLKIHKLKLTSKILLNPINDYQYAIHDYLCFDSIGKIHPKKQLNIEWFT